VVLPCLGSSGAKVNVLSLGWWRGNRTERTVPNTEPEAAPPSFENIIRDAELLLSYAATAGIELKDADVNILTDEIKQYKATRTASDETRVLTSYTNIANKILPVTALTLKVCLFESRRTLHDYALWGMVFAFIVSIASLLTFVSSSISDAIKTDIDVANSKAITLRAHLGNPGNNMSSPTYSEQDTLIDLQQFAISVRSIDLRAKRLSYLIFTGIPDPFKRIRDNKAQMDAAFELDPALADPYKDFVRILTTYQQVRAYAQSLRDGITFWYGGIVSSILPVFYALLGAAAWLLRRMQTAIRVKTFDNSDSKMVQFLVAAIAGMVIGLYNGLFASPGVSLSPFAWSFLAGYSSDSFFHVLDGGLDIRAGNRSKQVTFTA
jgi:hypothetical protein